MTIKTLMNKAKLICGGNEELVDELLSDIQLNWCEEYTERKMFEKYCAMCIDSIKEGQMMTAKRLADGIYELFDEHTQEYSICIIEKSGRITFYEGVNCFDTLTDYKDSEYRGQ